MHRVVVVGIGGLGCAVAGALSARADVCLRLVDGDVVEPTNLHRQVLFRMEDAGRPKALAAADALRRAGSPGRVEPVERWYDGPADDDLLREARVVVDGTDDIAAKFALSAAAVRLGVPVVIGGALGYEGQVAVVPPGGRPCLACFFGEPGDAVTARCAQRGVLGPMVGEVGARQAAQVEALLDGRRPSLWARVWMHDAMRGRDVVVPLEVDPACPVCGAHRQRSAGGTPGA